MANGVHQREGWRVLDAQGHRRPHRAVRGASSGPLAAAALLALAVGAYSTDTRAQRAEKPLPADAKIKRAIIADLLAHYPGPCPCPYNRARNGSRCGKRSAYSRPGGYSPICYDSDVTPAMVAAWQRRHDTRH
jgi:hypothetical protein